MGGQSGNAQARTDVEGDVGRQGHCLALGEHDELLCRPVRPLPRRLPEPNSLADALPRGSFPDGIDSPGAVLIRDELGKRTRVPGAPPLARLPIGRVDARDLHSHADFARAWTRHGALNEAEHLWPTRSE